jgi:hypothetical protein
VLSFLWSKVETTFDRFSKYEKYKKSFDRGVVARVELRVVCRGTDAKKFCGLASNAARRSCEGEG